MQITRRTALRPESLMRSEASLSLSLSLSSTLAVVRGHALLKISLQNTHSGGGFLRVNYRSISSRDTCGYYTRGIERGAREKEEEERRNKGETSMVGGLWRGNFISCDIMHAAEVMLDEVW